MRRALDHPGVILLAATALAWGYTLRRIAMAGMPMPDVAGMMDGMGTSEGLVPFLFGWAVMMAAMMLPAARPLLLLYRSTARSRSPRGRAAAGMAALLAGYLTVWTLAGLPVHAYDRLTLGAGASSGLLPGLLLIAGGAYQFTVLKRRCHQRCSSPYFFLARHWRPGMGGAARLGALHGVDCLGCCGGVMLALIALGMMNVGWMLAASVVIFVEKTLPGGHHVARPLGVALMAGGVLVLMGM